MIRFIFFKISQLLSNVLSVKAANAVACFLADAQYYLSRMDREAVLYNLKYILKTQDVPPCRVKEVFRNFGRYMVEFWRMKKIVNKEFLDKHLVIENEAYLEEIRKDGRGAILVTGHIGNWELGAAIINFLEFPITAVALPHKEKIVNDFFNKQRENQGVRVVPTTVAYRRCLESLKENRIVAIVGDRDFSRHGEAMPFLESEMPIPKGPALLALKTGKPIIPVFLIRQENGYLLRAHKPIYTRSCADKAQKDDIINIMEQYVGIIESVVREYPEQWIMFRKFNEQ